ncbi:RCC1 domain-containing protein 1 [Sparganum proliferum]
MSQSFEGLQSMYTVECPLIRPRNLCRTRLCGQTEVTFIADPEGNSVVASNIPTSRTCSCPQRRSSQDYCIWMLTFGHVRRSKSPSTDKLLRHSDWHASVYSEEANVKIVCGSRVDSFDFDLLCVASNSKSIFLASHSGKVLAYSKASGSCEELPLPAVKSFAANDEELFGVTDDNFVFSAPASMTEGGKKAHLSFPLSVKVNRGQLGHGDLESRDTPEIISALQPVTVVSIACGLWHCACLSDVGDVYTWGSNEYGQLGLPSLNLEKSRSDNDPTFFSESAVNVCALPSPVDLPSDVNVTEIACGSRHTACLTETGELFTFGWNGAGQLGFQPTFSSPEEAAGQYSHIFASDKPQRVDLDLGGQRVGLKVACGQWSTFMYRQPSL